MPMDGSLVLDKDGGAYMSGVDHGGMATVVARNAKAIVVKWPAHTYWASLGNREYASPMFAIYLVESNSVFEVADELDAKRFGVPEGSILNETIGVSALVDWDSKRKVEPVYPAWRGLSPEELTALGRKW